MHDTEGREQFMLLPQIANTISNFRRVVK